MSRVFNVKLGALDLTASPFMVLWDSLDEGGPENVVEVLESFLVDGDIETSPRAGNRTLSWTVGVEGANLLALATAEALLVTECEKPQNTLTITPGDGFSPPSVFETFRASLVFQRNEAGEDANLRRFTVTLRALPFARSLAETVTAALAPSGSTTTSVNDGTSLSGWTGSPNAAALVSGTIRETTGALAGTQTISLTLTQAITTSATKYLMLDYLANAGASISVVADGVTLPVVAVSGVPATGYARAWYYVAASSVAVLTITATSTQGSGITGPLTPPYARTLYVDQIQRTDVKPNAGTSLQSLRTIPMGGSVRTTGSLSVQHETNALGDVLVYTCPALAADGYVPAMRPRRTAGGTVVGDATAVSGSEESFTIVSAGGLVSFEVPTSQLPPGQYLAVVRVKEGGTAPNGTFVLTMTATQSLGGASQGISVRGPGSALAGWTILPVGLIQLPITAVPSGSTGKVSLLLTYTEPSSPLATLKLDELWLFNMTLGTLTQVACGTAAAAVGGPSKRLWIDAPTVTVPRPSIMRGHSADRSDSFDASASVTARGIHLFPPPSVSAFVVTTNAADAAVSASAYNRWHTNAAS